ncbi:aromatic ring-hydroxylating dioxygenase subunit alpha [Nostoc sp. ChiSLP03a]|uniref:aromatic ring-hydroxylating dioxygenase subunit alpha n=1 Tax=Nostoc sp. ChiSLP03a TaxID=3075380 RepID=UPI002AD3B8B8|nr:aromatic ring-hydroxylating dioxygenase subunit alpha [Nostoc sp. ChiSLP03a]MDZ8210070.1 aromatic ring-hydroxylating dioxygenase subunit alpha [Nostoc sp. ChiSLP03a]
MLKNFWYACEFSSAISSKPKRIMMLNQEFVLYRNSKGQVIAFLDQCPHRGAALSNGWVEDDCIRCPYHGWKFQLDGSCVEIPANQSSVPIPKKARLDAYPVQEKYGLVWLFWGDLPEEERPPLPLLPEFDNPAWRAVYGEFRWNAHYSRVLENQFDISHLPFVHSNSIGSGIAEQHKIEEYGVRMEELKGSATVTINQATKVRRWSKAILNKQSSRPLRVTVSFYMPNISWLEFDFPIGHFKMIIFSVHLPIDANTTVSKWIVLRNFFTTSWIDEKVRKSVLKPLVEDKPIVESQSPFVIPDDLTTEVHAPSDALSIAYRKLRKKFLDMGWGKEPVVNTSYYTNKYTSTACQDAAIQKVAIAKEATTNVV